MYVCQNVYTHLLAYMYMCTVYIKRAVPLCMCAIMYVCHYAYTHLLAYMYMHTVYIHSAVPLSSPSLSLFFPLSLSHTHSPIHISRSQLLGSRQIVITDDEVVFVGLSLLSPSHTHSFVQHTATHCKTRQHTATHGNTRQHTATHCLYIGHYYLAAV